MSTAERSRHLEIEQLLYHEALLLEQRRYEDWLALMTDDIVYYMPNGQEESDVDVDAMITRDDMPALKFRVARMYDPLNPALQPPPRTKYFVTNIMVDERADDVHVRSSLLLYIVHGSDVRHHPISCEYRLRHVEGEWKIAYKKVYMVENYRPLRQLPII